jgi:hypothetical protein
MVRRERQLVLRMSGFDAAACVCGWRSAQDFTSRKKRMLADDGTQRLPESKRPMMLMRAESAPVGDSSESYSKVSGLAAA